MTRRLLVVCIAALACSCNLVSGESAEDSSGQSAERPGDSDLWSLGPGEEKRIYYQFIDEKSQVRFVERLSDVPERWRDQAGFVEMSSPPPLSPADARKSRNQRYGGIEVASAGTANVLLYYADWCGYCVKAKRHLNRRGVPFELRDVDVPSAARELSSKTGGKGIPVLDVDGKIMRGWSADGYDRMLGQAGLL